MMIEEDRIHNAYRDLADRSAQVARTMESPASASADGPLSLGTARLAAGSRFRPGLLIAGLAVVAAGGAAAIGLAGGGDSQQVATETPTSFEDPAEGTDGDGGSTGDSSEPSDTGDSTIDTGDPTTADSLDLTTGGQRSSGDRYRVITSLVAADAQDPFLNVRFEPDSGSDLLAKLPATYTGLRATGQQQTADDGGIWYEIELIDPVAVTATDPETGRPFAGWVNAAFVEALPEGLAVSTEEVPACAGNSDQPEASGSLPSAHVYALDSAMVSEDCLRVVMTLGAGPASFGWMDLPADSGPATAVPAVFVTMSGGSGVSLDLDTIDSAWPDATETDDGVFMVRSDDGSLKLMMPTPANDMGVTAFPDRGIVVIDMRIIDPAPASGQGVVLTNPPAIGRGAIEVTGLARPFEANLGAIVEDAAGRPVEAIFSGNVALGTREATEYGVATNDWTEAWGQFALRVEGLEPGSYTLRLDAFGAMDDPETFDISFDITEAGERPQLATEAEQAPAQRLAGAARFDGLADLPLADEVTLALGPEPYRTATAAELAIRENWIAEVAGFGGFVGPFSPLDVVGIERLRITAGPVPQCASPPREWPSEFDGLRQVNIEPVGIDSCIAWFGVHLFLDDQDRIAGVSLDLFGP